jgi:peroxiredoxin Q/BCP
MIDRAPLPDSELPPTGNPRFQLSAFSGRPVVPCFHPEDEIPGRTDEGARLRDRHGQSAQVGELASRISRDSVPSHEKFKRKMSFPLELPSVIRHQPAPTRCPTIP